ncbi:MAG: dynamin family protein [Egicoccus sp.]
MDATRTAGAADDIGSLAAALEALDFALSGAAREELRGRAVATARRLRATLVRSADLDAPLLVVLAGGTGAGKSTTVNSLVGARVAATGVVRPTTHAPVLVCHPDDEADLVDAAILPHLPRVSVASSAGREENDDGSAGGQRLVVRTTDGLPPGLALVDTPDVDSVEAANRALAESVLDVADAWLWFVTARTYADEVGAAYLRLARDRQVLTGVVVTQVQARDLEVVLDDVARLLASEGVDADRLLHVPATDVADEQVPAAAVAPLREWLTGLAAPAARADVRRRALDGLRAAVPAELVPLADALAAEQATAERLQDALERSYRGLHAELGVELDRGIPLRADVLDRWRDMVGGGETMLRIQTAATRMREMVRGMLGTTDEAASSPRQVRAEVADTLSDTIVRLLERAAWEARRRFEEDPVGRELLDRQPALRSEDTERSHRVRAEVDAWGEHVAELVATIGAERRVQARVWSTALNAVATAAILVVFTVSGGLTGGELGIAALASAGSQALLVRLFGEQNLRNLLADARADLEGRLTRLIEADRARHDAALTGALPPADAHAVVRSAAGRRP